MNPFRTFLSIVEIRTKVVSTATFSAAALGSAAYLSENGAGFPWVNWLLMLAATLSLDMGTTGFNTYFDFVKGIDRKETNREEDKVLVHEGVSPAQAFFTSLALFSVAAVLGFIITVRTSWMVAAAGFMCMLVGFFYSAGPRPISHTPFGEFFAGSFLGGVLFIITWFVLTGEFSIRQIMFSIPLSLMISGILTVNNNCDLQNDWTAGRKTISVLFGLNAGRALLYLEYVTAIVFLVFMQFGIKAYPQGFPVLSACIIVLMVFVIFRMEKRGYSPVTKRFSMESVLRLFLLGALLVCYPWIIEIFC